MLYAFSYFLTFLALSNDRIHMCGLGDGFTSSKVRLSYASDVPLLWAEIELTVGVT